MEKERDKQLREVRRWEAEVGSEEWDLAMRPFWRTWRVLAGDSNLSAVLSKNLPIVLCTFVRGKTIKSMLIIYRRSFEILVCRIFSRSFIIFLSIF